MSAPSGIAEINARLKYDKAFRASWLAKLRLSRMRPEYRAMKSVAMKVTMSRPELRAMASAHARRINGDPRIRARQTKGKRGFVVPPAQEALFKQLRRKVGAKEALRIVLDEARREARRGARS